MEIEQLLNSIRDHYLETYRKEIALYKENFTPGAPEVLLETGSDRDYVYRLYRIDLASGAVDPPNLTEVNPDSFLNFETQQYELNGLEVKFFPIYWNGVEFNVTPSPKNDESLQQWALGWIDPEETATTDDYGLGNYVHSITTPETDGSTFTFSVDFGSSITKAFFELLETLVKEGAISVKVHSNSIIGVDKNDA